MRLASSESGVLGFETGKIKDLNLSATLISAASLYWEEEIQSAVEEYLER